MKLWRRIDFLFSFLMWQTMSTAVVQLYTTEGPAHSAWIKRLSGIACFIRDSSKRSYFIRVYCMVKHELAWEEEMYDSINVSKPREFLICFEGQVRCFYSSQNIPFYLWPFLVLLWKTRIAWLPWALHQIQKQIFSIKRWQRRLQIVRKNDEAENFRQLKPMAAMIRDMIQVSYFVIKILQVKFSFLFFSNNSHIFWLYAVGILVNKKTEIFQHNFTRLLKFYLKTNE